MPRPPISSLYTASSVFSCFFCRHDFTAITSFRHTGIFVLTCCAINYVLGAIIFFGPSITQATKATYLPAHIALGGTLCPATDSLPLYLSASHLLSLCLLTCSHLTPIFPLNKLPAYSLTRRLFRHCGLRRPPHCHHRLSVSGVPWRRPQRVQV
jgi:hypothetical protein